MSKMKNLKKYLQVVVFCSFVFGAGRKPPINEFGFTTGNQGTGLAYSGLWVLNPKINGGINFRYYDIKNEGEMPVYNYYTNRYENIDDKALILIPIMGIIKYFPFRDLIANNFSPFLSAMVGPVLSIDGKESERYFKKKWLKAPTLITPGGNVAAGVEFQFQGGSNISASVGYDIFPMGKNVDGQTHYNGLLLKLSVSRTY